LLSAEEVAMEILDGQVSPQWVKRNVPGKVRLGHCTVVWEESRVQRWKAEKVDAA
jgi:predicted DNA-binding transcriptional regulator AlpA